MQTGAVKAAEVLAVIFILWGAAMLSAAENKNGAQTKTQGPGLAAQYPGDAGIEKDKAVIFAEGFENGKLPTVGYDQVGGFYDIKDRHEGHPQITLAITDREAAVGKHSLELLNPGAVSPQWMHRRFEGRETVHVRFYRKWEKNWVWAMKGGEHDTYLFAGKYENPVNTDLTLYGDIRDGGKPGLVLKSRFQGPGLDFGLNKPVVSMKGPWDGYYGLPYNRTRPSYEQGGLEKGRWHCIEYMGKMNSAPGKKDGEVRLWVDGTLITEMKRLILRNATHEDIRWNHWCLGPRYGWEKGPSGVQKHWIDALVIASEYIGPVANKEQGK